MLIDIVVVILGLLAIYKGFTRGFVLAIFSLLSFIIGLAAALKLSALVAVYLGRNINLAQRWLPFLAFIAVFILMVNIFCNKPYVRNTFLYKIFEELGKYTYGLYVYSGLVITVFLFAMDKLHFVMPLYLVFLLQLLILIVISKLSYKYYEERFLRLSSKYRQ